MKTVLTPRSLEEFFTLQNLHPDPLLLSGGTDLLVRLRSQPSAAKAPLLCIDKLDELQGISEVGDDISIGAATSFSRIIASPLLQKHTPLLIQAARTIGGPAIRNMASIGGNICTASPAGDSLPSLYLLKAVIEIASHQGSRQLPISEFITGPGRTGLSAGEIVTRILIPRTGQFNRQTFEKAGRRKSMAIAVASFAGALNSSDAGIITHARFAWGSVAPTVARFPALEQELTGNLLTNDTIQYAAEVVRRGVSPISDIRAGSEYRRTVAGNLLVRFLEEQHG